MHVDGEFGIAWLTFTVTTNPVEDVFIYILMRTDTLVKGVSRKHE